MQDRPTWPVYLADLPVYLADLHVHSRFSRATSRDLELAPMAAWAARKGLAVIGTGDCVHPGWREELGARLEPADDGLFRLKPEFAREAASGLPPLLRESGGKIRFMLSTEISTVYRHDGRTRRVHHLVYPADLEAADRLAGALARIGNIASDGRPILGLPSRDLLEIVLEADPRNWLVPAHVWTPWYSALGEKSGYDSIDACYRDLAPHVFAVETGLSSDPAMNWRVSFLDRYRLVSNSDAHSPGKLGREATRFAGVPGAGAIRRALETGEGYVGTVEFFPEEGKYHADGHRACGVRLSPAETRERGGACPVCGRKVTTGVEHRTLMLADRDADGLVPPPTAGSVVHLTPLPDILGEIFRVAPGSRRVAGAYDAALAALGPEAAILQDVPLDEIGRHDAVLGEAVARLRRGEVRREPGYDGAWGRIRLFGDGELARGT